MTTPRHATPADDGDEGHFQAYPAAGREDIFDEPSMAPRVPRQPTGDPLFPTDPPPVPDAVWSAPTEPVMDRPAMDQPTMAAEYVPPEAARARRPSSEELRPLIAEDTISAELEAVERVRFTRIANRPEPDALPSKWNVGRILRRFAGADERLLAWACQKLGSVSKTVVTDLSTSSIHIG